MKLNAVLRWAGVLVALVALAVTSLALVKGSELS